MARCLEWAEERHEECVEWRDDGYGSCSDWDADCCDWWPCSWGCKLVTWFCVAWVWVSHWVCVAWNVVTTAVCVVWDAVTTALNALLVTLESLLGWILDALAFLAELVFSIPYLGRLLKWLWGGLVNLAWALAGLLDGFLGLIGIRPEKKLRVCTLILRDEKSNPVATVPFVVDLLRVAADVLKREANVRLVRLAPFEYDSGFAGGEQPDETWVQTVDQSCGSDVLDVPCNADGFAADLGLTGSKLDLMAATRCFFGSFRRVVGYGGPVTCFVIRSLPTDDDPRCGGFGCGLWITDYVTVRNQPCASDGPTLNRRVTAHELGHSGSLWHIGAGGHPTNLMGVPWDGTDPPAQVKLDTWQILLLRESKHVTYF